MKKVLLAIAVLALSVLSCNSGNPDRKLNLYPSATSDATQTPYVVTALHTQVVQITTTPIPPVPTFTITATHVVGQLCVNADEAVYLRPSASTENYPVIELRNGTVVKDLGGRENGFVFVEAGDKRGWVSEKYLEVCK